jgi:hypothetical protein
MRDHCTPQMVALLARSAGFEFASARCELLAPQLDWLLVQGDLLMELSLGTEEPVLVFRPDTAAGMVGKELEHG